MDIEEIKEKVEKMKEKYGQRMDYGVKGMKRGVRKSNGAALSNATGATNSGLNAHSGENANKFSQNKSTNKVVSNVETKRTANQGEFNNMKWTKPSGNKSKENSANQYKTTGWKPTDHYHVNYIPGKAPLFFGKERENNKPVYEIPEKYKDKTIK